MELYLYSLFDPSWSVTGRNLPVCNRALYTYINVCTYVNLHWKPLHCVSGLATALQINTVAVQSCMYELKYCGLSAFSGPSVGNIVCLEAFRPFPATTWPFTSPGYYTPQPEFRHVCRLRLACLRKSADYKRLIDTVFVVLADIFDTVRIEDIVYILTILISPVYLVKI